MTEATRADYLELGHFERCGPVRRGRLVSKRILAKNADYSTYSPISGSRSAFVESGIASSGVLIVPSKEV